MTGQDHGRSDAQPTPRRAGLGLLEVLVIVGIIGIGLGLLIPAVNRSREAARKSQCICNLCGITIALHNYHDTFGTLPPAYLTDAQGHPAHSWRVLLLPWLEHSPLHESYRYSELWNGPHNQTLAAQMPRCFSCPSRRPPPSGPETRTSYLAITGPGTAFPPDQTVRFDEITDGLAETLMIAESTGQAVPWMSPHDLDVRRMSFRINDPARPSISSPHPAGPSVAFADGRYRTLSPTTPPETVRGMTTIAAGDGPGSHHRDTESTEKKREP